MYPKTSPVIHNNPFGKRPWLKDNGAAAPAGGGNMGLKGIIAGNIPCVQIFVKQNMR